MDDIFKILFGVIFVAYSIYSSTKKKKAKAAKLAEQNRTASRQNNYNNTSKTEVQPVNENTKKKASIFDILEQQLNPNIETNNTYAEENIQQEYNIEEEKEITEYDDGKLHSDLQVKEEPKATKIYENTEEETVDFDLRQAVIYSELLKPKYF